MDTSRSNMLAIAKQGFSHAIRTGQYMGNIGPFLWAMDRDDWSVCVSYAGPGKPRTFKIAKSWQA